MTLIHAFQRMFSLLTVKVEDEDEFLIYLIPPKLTGGCVTADCKTLNAFSSKTLDVLLSA